MQVCWVWLTLACNWGDLGAALSLWFVSYCTYLKWLFILGVWTVTQGPQQHWHKRNNLIETFQELWRLADLGMWTLSPSFWALMIGLAKTRWDKATGGFAALGSQEAFQMRGLTFSNKRKEAELKLDWSLLPGWIGTTPCWACVCSHLTHIEKRLTFANTTCVSWPHAGSFGFTPPKRLQPKKL